MADPTATAWARIAKQLAEELPGEWRIARSGIKTILVREPIDWVVVWVGVNRTRRDDLPRLIGGDAPLVGPFHLAVGHGLRSDQRPDGPHEVDPRDPQAKQHVVEFITDDLLPRIDSWSPDRYAAASERQLGQPNDEREPPIIFPEAAGWRIVLDNGSPIEPATEAARWLADNYAPDEAKWYASLSKAWESGGRPAAWEYLEEDRAAALASLRLK